MEPGQPQNPLTLSAETAIENGTLPRLAKAVNDVTLMRYFFAGLLEKSEGTGKIESEAYAKLKDMKSKIIQGRGQEMGEISKLNILRFRATWMVKDILELKVKHLRKEENEVRRVYRKESESSSRTGEKKIDSKQSLGE